MKPFMAQLVLLDYAVITIYFLLLLGIGYYVSRKQNAENFLISERKLDFFCGLATINASKTGAYLIVYTSFLYQYGFSATWNYLGFAVGYAVFIPFASRLYRNSSSFWFTSFVWFFSSNKTLS